MRKIDFGKAREHLSFELPGLVEEDRPIYISADGTKPQELNVIVRRVEMYQAASTNYAVKITVEHGNGQFYQYYIACSGSDAWSVPLEFRFMLFLKRIGFTTLELLELIDRGEVPFSEIAARMEGRWLRGVLVQDGHPKVGYRPRLAGLWKEDDE